MLCLTIQSYLRGCLDSLGDMLIRYLQYDNFNWRAVRMVVRLISISIDIFPAVLLLRQLGKSDISKKLMYFLENIVLTLSYLV